MFLAMKIKEETIVFQSHIIPMRTIQMFQPFPLGLLSKMMCAFLEYTHESSYMSTGDIWMMEKITQKCNSIIFMTLFDSMEKYEFGKYSHFIYWS